MVEISFSHPQYLFFLFIIPLFILIHFITLRTSRASALKFANFDLIARIRGIEFFSRNIAVLILSSIVATLIILALSGLTVHTIVDASSQSFILAIDASKSKEATDFVPSRLEAAKESVISFVNDLPISTRVGVISFSGNSFIEQEVTDDRGLVRNAIQNTFISTIGGTDFYEAVITATNLLRGEETKAIIILSDGQENVGALDEAIAYANDNNVIIHTFAVGTEEGGETSFGISKVNVDALKALAFNTDGEFFMTKTKEELGDALKGTVQITERKTTINFSKYLMIAAIILFALEYLLINTRYRRLP